MGLGVFQSAPCLRPDELASSMARPDKRVQPVSLPVGAACPCSASTSLMSCNPHVPPSFTVSIPTLKLAVVNHVKAFLSEFSDTFSERFSSVTPKHGITYDIVTTVGPFTCCPCHLSPEKLDAASRSFWPWTLKESCVAPPTHGAAPFWLWRRKGAASVPVGIIEL